MMSNNSSRIVVGLDFGTTFSSAAFAFSGTPDTTKLVATWPGHSSGCSSGFVPSELHYLDPKGDLGRIKWGYQIEKDIKNAPDPIQWFKLLLKDGGSMISGRVRRNSTASSASLDDDDSFEDLGPNISADFQALQCTATTTPADKAAAMLDHLGIDPVCAIGDFLTGVRKTIVEELERSYLSQWISGTKTEYVLTVPAIWSDAAKQKMIQAASAAGFGQHRVDFNLISEPEAAATYTLKAAHPHGLVEGDTFVICDAGGGTVDLITYGIKCLSPLQFEECVSGTGELCGSVFLNHRFEDYIKRVIGKEQFTSMKPRAKRDMMEKWERVKERFDGEYDPDGHDVSVGGIKDNDDKNIEDGYHTMSSADVKNIFEPIVDQIVDLVAGQISRAEKRGYSILAIFLVGGFGTSHYLRKRIELATKLQVLQPPDARTAIAYGALLKGLEGSSVASRRSRVSYGVTSNTFLREGLPGESSHLTYNVAEERWDVAGRCTWYLNKDDKVNDDWSCSFPFVYNVLATRNPDLHFSSKMYTCELDEAPLYKWQNPQAVRTSCTMSCDLSSLPLSNFHKIKNSSGVEFYRIHVSIKMSIKDEYIKLEKIVNGEVCGEAQASFEFE